MAEKYSLAMYLFVFFKPSFIRFQFSSSLQCLEPWYLELESSSKAPPSERRSELNIRQFVSFITFLLRRRMQVKNTLWWDFLVQSFCRFSIGKASCESKWCLLPNDRKVLVSIPKDTKRQQEFLLFWQILKYKSGKKVNCLRNLPHT